MAFFLLACVLFSLPASSLGKMIIFAEPGRLDESLKGEVHSKLEELMVSISPNSTYKAGQSFYGYLTANSTKILFNLHFYDERFCDPSFVNSVPSALGSVLLDGFKPVMRDASELASSGGYGSGVVIHGQYQVGYTMQGTKLVGPDNCTRLTMVYNNSLDYCYGYSGMLQSHTPWNFLYSGCLLRAPNHKYILQMQTDCNLVLTDTDANKVLWASNTDLSGRGCYLVLQEDMNLVIYDGSNNKAVWASGTYNSSLGATQLIMRGDGYGVVNRNDVPGLQLWGTFNWQH